MGRIPFEIHHFRLTRAAVEDVFRTLALESAADRRHNPGLEPERVDVIVGGTIVVLEVLRRYDLDALRFSVRDLLDGAALEAAALPEPVEGSAPPGAYTCC